MRIDESDMESKWIHLAQSGDPEAIQALIEMHRPLIGMLSLRVYTPYIERDVLIQAGCIGLMQAVMHYRQEMDVKLITYAVPWILGEMKKALRREAASGISLEGMTESEERRSISMLCGCEDVDLSFVDLRMALEKLGEELRLVICLRYFRDKTQKETAVLLQKSQTQISRMERRALDELHGYLA